MKSFAFLGCAFLILTSSVRAEIRFSKSTFSEACAQAAREHKPIMIDFYTDWCHWCHVLDDKTYGSPAVASFANDHFICLKLNAERGEGIQLAQRFGVHGYPTIVFLDESAQETYRVGGFEPPEKFLQSLKVGGMGSLPSLEARAASHPDDAETVFALAERYSTSYNPTKAAEYYTKVVQLDEGNRLHLAEKAAFPLAVAAYRGGNIAELEHYVETYPLAEVNGDLHKTLALALLRIDTTKSRHHSELAHAALPDDNAFLNTYASECADAGVNLTHALAYSKVAVEHCTKPIDKASTMGTQASVLFAMKKYGDAIAVEKDALAQLTKESKYDRLRTSLETQLKKYQQAGTQ